jgi:hypothetical protein
MVLWAFAAHSFLVKRMIQPQQGKTWPVPWSVMDEGWSVWESPLPVFNGQLTRHQTGEAMASCRWSISLFS